MMCVDLSSEFPILSFGRYRYRQVHLPVYVERNDQSADKVISANGRNGVHHLLVVEELMKFVEDRLRDLYRFGHEVREQHGGL